MVPNGWKSRHVEKSFRNANELPEGWKEVCLKEIADIRLSGVDKKSHIGQKTVRLCNYTDVYANDYITNSINFTKATATDLEIDNFALQSGDVIITKDSETPDDIGVPSVVVENFPNVLCGYHLALLRPKKDLADSIYVANAISHNNVRRQFARLANGVTRFGLTKSVIENTYIPLPPCDEQRKIGAILALWRKAIGNIETLLKEKQHLKQALMQKLLTGKLRFKEFIKSNMKTKTHYGVIPGDWEYSKVEEIADEVSDRNEKGRNIPVLSCTKYDGLVDSLQYFGKRIFSEDTSDYKIVRRDQFAYATNHIEEGSIGLLDSLDKGLVSPMYTVFKTDENVYAPYLYKVFKTELYRHIFEANTSGSIDRRGGLRWKQFSQIHIPLPSIEEQKKIFACIDTRDREIRLLQQLVEALKTQKKGLMQKLLTGKIRVNV